MKVVPNVPLREILESLALDDEDEDTTVSNTVVASSSSPLVAPILADTPQEQQFDQSSSWKDSKVRARKAPRPLQLADPVEPEVQKLRLAAPEEEQEGAWATFGGETWQTFGRDYDTKKSQQCASKKQLQLAAAVAPQDAVLVKPPSSHSSSLLVAKGGSTAPLIHTTMAVTENGGGNKERGRRETYDEENIHSNHHVSPNNPNGEEEMSPDPPNTGFSSSKRWVRIGIGAFLLGAIIGAITGITTGEKCPILFPLIAQSATNTMKTHINR